MQIHFNMFRGLLLILGILVFVQCRNDKKATPTPENVPAPTVTPKPTPEILDAADIDFDALTEDQKRYAWLDRANIRKEPSIKSPKVATAKKGDLVAFTGEQTGSTEYIVLRGLIFDEPWLKIVTKDGVEGWAYGGTLRKEYERKGNDIINDTRFNFPYFGRFDLRAWDKEPVTEIEEGDATIITKKLKKGNQAIEIIKTDMGEYGYNHVHRLLDANGRPIKTRTFEFKVDPDFELVETVVNHATFPATQYRRRQLLDVHYIDLNDRPAIAQGQWREMDVDKN